MTARKSWDEIMERKHITRMNRDDKTVERLERLEEKAMHLIGELCREGSQADLLAFLIRNGYVR